MKKHVLLSLCCLPLLSSGQVVFEDDFESYASGAYIAENSNGLWTTWSGTPGSSEDAPASTEQAHSGTVSAKFDSPTAAGPTDFVYDFGNLTTGHYQLTMWMYVAGNSGAYFNIMHQAFPPGEWAVDAYFDADGSGYLLLNNVENAFTYTNAAWNEIKVDINMDTDQAEFFVNGTSVHQWQWSIQNNAAAGMNQMAWLDIFAAAPTGTPALFYVDDVRFENLAGGNGFSDLVRGEEVRSYPNPVADVVTVQLEQPLSPGATVELVNLTGARVNVPSSTGGAKLRFDMRTLAAGVYFVRINEGGKQRVEKLVKN
jgi:hypothetical protein